MQQDLHITNKCITSESTDYLSARVPTIKKVLNNISSTAKDNVTKEKVPTNSFFPLPPPVSCVPPDFAYHLLKGI